MSIDLTRLTEDELLDLNRRIVERLRLIQSAKRLTQLARFSVGMTVEFTVDGGRTLRGVITRLNQKTATVLTEAGQWRVSPSFLRRVEPIDVAAADSRIVAMPDRRRDR